MPEQNPFQSPQEVSQAEEESLPRAEKGLTSLYRSFVIIVLMVLGGIGGLVVTITLVNVFVSSWRPAEFVLLGILSLGINIGAGSGVWLGVWMLKQNPPKDTE